MDAWLKQFRLAVEFRGISQAELARRAGIDAQAVRRYLDENQPNAPKIPDAIKLAAALDMTLDQAFSPGFPLASSRILRRLHEGLAELQFGVVQEGDDKAR